MAPAARPSRERRQRPNPASAHHPEISGSAICATTPGKVTVNYTARTWKSGTPGPTEWQYYIAETDVGAPLVDGQEPKGHVILQYKEIGGNYQQVRADIEFTPSNAGQVTGSFEVDIDEFPIRLRVLDSGKWKSNGTADSSRTVDVQAPSQDCNPCDDIGQKGAECDPCDDIGDVGADCDPCDEVGDLGAECDPCDEIGERADACDEVDSDVECTSGEEWVDANDDGVIQEDECTEVLSGGVTPTPQPTPTALPETTALPQTGNDMLPLVAVGVSALLAGAFITLVTRQSAEA